MSHTSEESTTSTATKRPAIHAGAEKPVEQHEHSPEELTEKPDARQVLRHVHRGVSDMLIKHLNGWVMGAASFIEEREKAHAEEKVGVEHTLRHLSVAYRKYNSHAHHAGADFVDHMLDYKKHKPYKTRKK